MTIKVYRTNSDIDEYPNAHITWEWDDMGENGERGTNSGFRINAIDNNCTTVSAFIYPSECTKIEITSEECDRIFKSPPQGSCISGKRYRIFTEIDQERKRQDEKWGENSDNHLFEWVSILTEEVGELAEAINETCFKSDHVNHERGGKEAILKEAIQVAAVATAIIESVKNSI
jgi:NTP pyrophosphatase (non-canonical NTP hydrolase)